MWLTRAACGRAALAVVERVMGAVGGRVATVAEGGGDDRDGVTPVGPCCVEPVRATAA